MAYINHLQLAELNELLDDNLTAWEGEEDSVKEEHAELIERLQAFDLTNTNTLATPEEVEKARSIFQKGWGEFSDEIEIDDEAVGVSRADEGTWVNAWVWIPNDKEQDDDA